MKKIKIIKNAQVTNEATFANDELLNEWLTTETTNLSFGHPERLIIDYVENPISEELKALAVEVTQVDVNGEMRDQYKIPSEFSYEIEDITVQVEGETRRLSLIAQGEKTALACKDAFNLIAGYNQFRALSSAQKDQMASLFSPIVQALKIYERPSVAKALVTAIEPDGILVTSEMKADMLEILKDF